jgi:hypothetical protein
MQLVIKATMRLPVESSFESEEMVWVFAVARGLGQQERTSKRRSAATQVKQPPKEEFQELEKVNGDAWRHLKALGAIQLGGLGHDPA